MKRIISAVMLVLTIIPTGKVIAQASSSAHQLIKVHSVPTIHIMALSSPNIHLGFNSIAQYMQGIESQGQKFKVVSNKDFVISVKTNSSLFSYTGTAYPKPRMPVDDILFLSVSDNQTGGSIANSFNAYKSLSCHPKDLLLNCKNGGNKSFIVNYRANPGTEFPAGDYTVDVIYTATQP